MTLHLLGPLRWQDTEGRASLRLPATLPVAILLVLARDGAWLARTKLAAIFWPDAPTHTAQLNLRVNMHKARRLLHELGIGVALESDRRSLRWAPPTDLGTDGNARGRLAAEFELPGFDRFEAWLRDWRESCAGASLHVVESDAFQDAADEFPIAVPAETSFYGRRIELGQLRSSNTPATVVAGSAGVGKSRLVAEALNPQYWLRCRAGLREASFGAVAYLFATHPEWLRDLGAYRLDIARLLPEVAPDEPLPPLDALTARVRLFEALARTLERHTALLAVDDLQWADAATVEWLVMLAHRRRTRWVATARDEELPAPARAALQAMETARVGQVVVLQGLDRTALNALLHDRRPDLAAAAGFPRPHPWLDALARYTGGNAFCAIEVMDALGPSERAARLDRLPLPDRVALMLHRRRLMLGPAVRGVVDAAALAVGQPSLKQLAAMADLDGAQVLTAIESANSQGLMHGMSCRHDIVRDAIRAAISLTRTAELHRRAALHLSAEHAEPETIAHHWRLAGDHEAAWPWVLAAAQRLKQRGERDAAVALLCEVRDGTRDPALALRADIMLAQERLFDDLVAGRAALESALVRAENLAHGIVRQTIEAHALAGLVDNAVFGGDLVRAAGLATALQERLPGLARDVLIEAHQVLIEATMRQGDFAAARASLEGLRQARAAAAIVLSFEAQIHWFIGDVREARQVFEQLLARHAEYCQGLTIENDLAVMCHALGDLGAAEEMARRSLRSWAGVAHTEALSSLVLGSTLTSMGRFNEAFAAFDRAHELGQQQGSSLFAGEALARRARAHWCAGQASPAHEAAVAARRIAGELVEPLRASGLALVVVLTSIDEVGAPDLPALAALEKLHLCSRHPLVHVRYWRALGAAAESRGARSEALHAARRQETVARDAGLLEWLCEAQGLVARFETGAASDIARAQAQAQAHAQGFGWLITDVPGTLGRPRRIA